MGTGIERYDTAGRAFWDVSDQQQLRPLVNIDVNIDARLHLLYADYYPRYVCRFLLETLYYLDLYDHEIKL